MPPNGSSRPGPLANGTGVGGGRQARGPFLISQSRFPPTIGSTQAKAPALMAIRGRVVEVSAVDADSARGRFLHRERSGLVGTEQPPLHETPPPLCLGLLSDDVPQGGVHLLPADGQLLRKGTSLLQPRDDPIREAQQVGLEPEWGRPESAATCSCGRDLLGARRGAQARGAPWAHAAAPRRRPRPPGGG